jgi:hypothetical protein
MKQFILAVSVMFMAIGSFAQKQVISDANAQDRNLKGFHGVKVSHAIDVYISQGNEEGVAVSAKTIEYRDKIKTEVVDGILRISYDERSWKGGNRQLKAYVSIKNVDLISASGACDVIATGTLKAKELKLDLSGASDFKGAIEAEFINADISGASDLSVSGRVDGLKIEASGASSFKGYDLQSEKCEVRATGASDVNITVNKELNAQASGASGINYKGAGVIRDIKTSGASNVSRKG